LPNAADLQRPKFRAVDLVMAEQKFDVRTKVVAMLIKEK
jgi:hypothetical protein